MNTEKRYITRIVLPVVLAGILAVTANMIYRAATSDPNDKVETSYILPPTTTPGTSYNDNESQSSENNREDELRALQLSLNKLEEAAPEDSSPQIERLKKAAESKVAALEQAPPSEWVALRAEAYETVETYAAAIGMTKE